MRGTPTNAAPTFTLLGSAQGTSSARARPRHIIVQSTGDRLAYCLPAQLESVCVFKLFVNLSKSSFVKWRVLADERLAQTPNSNRYQSYYGPHFNKHETFLYRQNLKESMFQQEQWMNF